MYILWIFRGTTFQMVELLRWLPLVKINSVAMVRVFICNFRAHQKTTKFTHSLRPRKDDDDDGDDDDGVFTL